MDKESEKRSRFLRLAKEFDDNYTPFKGSLKETLLRECREKGMTVKENLKGGGSKLDYGKLKNITLKHDNPFKYFYDNSDYQLGNFFKQLHNIKLMLEKGENSFIGVRDVRGRNLLIKKYEAVIEDLENNGHKACNEVIERKKYLESPPRLTKRRLFEHLLFEVWIYISYCKGKEEVKATDTIANITTQIIKEYFDEDITFTRKTNIKNFNKYTYYLFRSKQRDILKEKHDTDVIIFHS